MTKDLDATGLRCPLPVIRMETALRSMNSGDNLEITADDPIARLDIPHFCREAGHGCMLIFADEETGNCVFLVTKG
ncbi:MAG: sulfurtransferase TusA family protein [Pseudomonadota bacterium]